MKFLIIAAVSALVILSACTKETDNFKLPELSEYVPLQPGKYITYQLDSFRYLPFSVTGITITYQVKFLVDAAITDNLGRPAFRVIRYIRKATTDPWVSDNTFTAINTGSGFEFIDNNLRFLKLKSPVRNGFSWKGNAFINTTTQFTDFRYLDGWDYTYDSVGAPLTLGTNALLNTVKVAQRDEVIGNPSDVNSYSEINFGVEYYAKGIGLVYKRIFHSEYQPPTTPNGSGYYSDASKGYTLTMIDHN